MMTFVSLTLSHVWSIRGGMVVSWDCLDRYMLESQICFLKKKNPKPATFIYWFIWLHWVLLHSRGGSSVFITHGGSLRLQHMDAGWSTWTPYSHSCSCGIGPWQGLSQGPLHWGLSQWTAGGPSDHLNDGYDWESHSQRTWCHQLLSWKRQVPPVKLWTPSAPGKHLNSCSSVYLFFCFAWRATEFSRNQSIWTRFI